MGAHTRPRKRRRYHGGPVDQVRYGYLVASGGKAKFTINSPGDAVLVVVIIVAIVVALLAWAFGAFDSKASPTVKKASYQAQNESRFIKLDSF